MPILLGTACLKSLVLWGGPHYKEHVWQGHSNAESHIKSLHMCGCLNLQTETILVRSNLENGFKFFIYVHIYTHRVFVYIIYCITVCIYNIPYICMHTYTQTYLNIHTPLFSLLKCLFTSQTSGYGEVYFPDHISIHRPIPTSSCFPYYMIDNFKSRRKND